MAGFRIEGNTSGNVAEVTAENRIKVGTAPSAGVIAHLITFDYGWE